MTDRTQSGSRPQASRWRESRGAYPTAIIIALVIGALGTVIGGYLYGRFLSARDLNGRDTVIEQLRSENQKLKRTIDEKQASLTALQTKLASAEAALQAILPSKNTYNIVPNQTLLLADGKLAVGLIGSPGNEGITLNINGKQQTVTVGQFVTAAADSTNCQIGVQSFDMFKAVLTASCNGAKAQ